MRSSTAASRLDVVRAIEDGGGRLDRARWQELGETGVFSLRLPEADGGLELGVSEAVLVFEELGRAIVPGPLVASHLAAEIIPEAATGEQIVGILQPSVPVTMVEFLDDLDVLLVLDDDGVHRVDPAALATQNVDRPLDPLSPVRFVTGDIPAGVLVAGPDVAQRWLLTGAVLTGGLQVGIADRTVELATEYAKEREQFGRAIGSFQAIKHLIADMFVKAAVARAGVESAACALDGRSDDDPVRAASVGEDHGRRSRAFLRPYLHPGARRHRVHVGSRRATVLEARLRARHALRQRRRARRSRRVHALTRRGAPQHPTEQ